VFKINIKSKEGFLAMCKNLCSYPKYSSCKHWKTGRYMVIPREARLLELYSDLAEPAQSASDHVLHNQALNRHQKSPKQGSNRANGPV
jgi:hypothetical protein